MVDSTPYLIPKHRRHALNTDRKGRSLTESADDVGVPELARRTRADGAVLRYRAQGVRSARVLHQTRVKARARDASLVGLARSVDRATARRY